MLRHRLGVNVVIFIREVDTRNCYASFEAIFVHQNWHIGCVNRLSRMCDSANSSNLTGFVDCRFVKVASVGR